MSWDLSCVQTKDCSICALSTYRDHAIKEFDCVNMHPFGGEGTKNIPDNFFINLEVTVQTDLKAKFCLVIVIRKTTNV